MMIASMAKLMTLLKLAEIHSRKLVASNIFWVHMQAVAGLGYLGEWQPDDGLRRLGSKKSIICSQIGQRPLQLQPCSRRPELKYMMLATTLVMRLMRLCSTYPWHTRNSAP